MTDRAQPEPGFGGGEHGPLAAGGTAPDGIRNTLHGVAIGPTVQAGVVHGGIHIHHTDSETGAPPMPRQLPTPPHDFVGRAEELGKLDHISTQAGRRRLVLITGPAGVGKSALALWWSERARELFPDGQLYAELGAFAPAGPVVPGAVLGRFLRSLGIPAEQVPMDVAEQLGLFRSLVAERRLLIVLDDALSAGQVRQLLPNAPGCMVVVTARWRLAGLVGDGATILAVEPLDERGSQLLLAARIGADRMSVEPDAAASLARVCGGLPIALSITAARLAVHPRWSIGRVLAELSDERLRLAGLSIQEDTSMRATLDLTYRSLAPSVARCYRAAGLHPGRGPGAPVIAAALAAAPDEATAMLDALVEASLLGDAPDDRRYQMHDLVRLHARHHAETDPERDLFVRRTAEWYLSGVQAADILLTPYRRRVPARFLHLGPGSAVVLVDRDDALDWLERERANLVATVLEAAPTMPETAWLIADGMWPLFHYHRHHDDRMLVDRVAVECARRLGNVVFEARMLKRWAFAHADANRLTEAAELFESSGELFRRLDDRYGVAAAVEGLGAVALAQRRFAVAADCFAEELAICQELGERRRAALALLNLGTVANAAGDPARAVEFLARAGDLDAYNAARCRIELGRALLALGEHTASAAELNQALTEMTGLDSPRGQAQARQALGELALAGGKATDAATELRLALGIYERIGDTEADDVRRLLSPLPPAQADPYRMSQP